MGQFIISTLSINILRRFWTVFGQKTIIWTISSKKSNLILEIPVGEVMLFDFFLKYVPLELQNLIGEISWFSGHSALIISSQSTVAQSIFPENLLRYGTAQPLAQGKPLKACLRPFFPRNMLRRQYFLQAPHDPLALLLPSMLHLHLTFADQVRGRCHEMLYPLEVFENEALALLCGNLFESVAAQSYNLEWRVEGLFQGSFQPEEWPQR